MESRDNSYCSDFSKRHHPNHQLSPPFLPQYTARSFQSDAQTESRNRILQSFHGSCYFFQKSTSAEHCGSLYFRRLYIHIYIHIYRYTHTQCLYNSYVYSIYNLLFAFVSLTSTAISLGSPTSHAMACLSPVALAWPTGAGVTAVCLSGYMSLKLLQTYLELQCM